MIPSMFLQFTLVLLATLSRSAAIQLATSNALYSWYNNYALHSAYNFTAYTLATATKEFCAYLCTATANCFAATLMISSKQCLVLSGGCGILSLQTNNNAVTSVKAGLLLATQKPVINYPFVSNCGSWDVQVGNGSLSTPIINNAVNITTFATNQTAASNVLSFTAPLSTPLYIFMADASGTTLPQFSSDDSYTISLMFRPNSLTYNQIILSLTTADNRSCIIIWQGTANYSPCIAFAWNSNNCTTQQFYSVYVVTMNTWYHTAVVYNSIAHTYTLYINGKPVAIVAYTPVALSLGISGLYIGNYAIGAYNYNFMGQLYCLQIFKAALSYSEIINLNSICQFGGVFLN